MTEALTAQNSGELTVANIGEVVIFAYADFLRRHSNHMTQARQHQVTLDAYQAERGQLIADPMNEAVTDAEFRERMYSFGRNITYLERIVVQEKHLAGDCTLDWANDREREVKFELPPNRRVRVEDVSEKGGVIQELTEKGAHTGKSVRSAKGKLWAPTLSTNSYDKGSFYLYKGGRAFGRPKYTVQPIVDKDYQATIKLTYLD